MYAKLIVKGTLSNVKKVEARTNQESGIVTPAHNVFQFMSKDEKKGISTIDVKDKENKITKFEEGKELELPVTLTMYGRDIFYNVV